MHGYGMGMQGWNSGWMWICGLVLIVALVLIPSGTQVVCDDHAPSFATSGGELEQIQFLLGHASVLTTG